METNLLNQVVQQGKYYPSTEEERETLRRAFRENTPVGELAGMPAYVTRIENTVSDDEYSCENFVIEVRFPVPPPRSGPY
jgi:hypothetical protein